MNIDIEVSLPDALVILVRGGMDIQSWTLAKRVREGRYKGFRRGRDWFMPTTEIDRILKEELNTND